MSDTLMPFAGNLLTTGMGILPHKEMERALAVAMSVDIPFWPQLPRMNYFEDMYVQASENFPGIILEPENRKIYLQYGKILCRAGKCPDELWKTKTFFACRRSFPPPIIDFYPMIYPRMYLSAANWKAR